MQKLGSSWNETTSETWTFYEVGNGGFVMIATTVFA